MSSLIQTVQQLSQAMAGLEAQAPEAVCDQQVALRSAWEALRAAAADLQREDQAVKTALAAFQQERRHLEAQRALLRQRETEITGRLRSVAAQETRLAETVAGQVQAQTTALRQEKEKLAGQLQEIGKTLQERERDLNTLTATAHSLNEAIKNQTAEADKWRRLAEGVAGQARQLMVEIPLSRLTGPERARLFDWMDTDADRHAVIDLALRDLHPDQALAVTLRFGLDGTGPHTFEEVAAALDVSPDFARRIVKETLRRLRYPRLGRHLRDFWD